MSAPSSRTVRPAAALEVKRATTDAEILACLPVLAQLRPQLTAESIVPRIRELERGGFRMAYIADEDGAVRAVAGYRHLDMLYSGKQIYVDDLVTDAAARSRGYGRALHDWLLEEARSSGCEMLTLDSGVQRFEAHRFYFRQRMTIHGYHFVMPCRAAERDTRPPREEG